MPKLPSIILGISYGHGDSSAALVVDGRLVAAAEEERFTRVKHYGLFPTQAIAYCLKHAKIEARQVEVVAIPRDPRNAFFRKISLGFLHPGLHRAGRAIDQAHPQPLRRMLQQSGLRRARVQRVEHHLAHMASARWMIDGNDVALLSFDGLGDFVSAAIGKTTEEEGIHITDRMFFPDSLGFFYTAMTQYLGFPHFGEEFKVMGLSSYGKPRYLAAMRELVRESEPFGFKLNLEAFPILKHPIRFALEKAQPKIFPYYQKNFLTQVIGIPPRKPTEPLLDVHRDLACSIQLRFEEIANHLLTQLYERAGGDALALSGGCAHNSVWVGKIPRVSPYRRIMVAPAAHDAGLAAGAAAEAAGRPVAPEGDHWGLLGPDIDELPHEIAAGMRERNFNDETALINWAVKEIAEGKILGLAHGRMEFGPRALGHRSILADPRSASMRDKLNQRVKHRETFRPFAASVLWEHQAKWFNSSFFSPSMEAVFEVQESARNRIPAVTHVDNTCRVQSVVKDTQPFFWKLLEAFRKTTGVPMLLNTSFNDNEPIVCSAADAFRCFQGTDMDAIIVGDKVYTKADSKKLAG